MSIKYWRVLSECKNNNNDIQNIENFSPLCTKIINARGKDKYVNIEDEISILTENKPLKDLDLAVSRIRKAIENGEKITVYGDYDCDGITSTALLYSYLESEGADISYYIPDRDKEGYGLNLNAIKALKENNIDLIITVDNGISAIAEVDFAQTIGIDVIVTDHHQPRETLPNAVAILDPHRNDCESNLTYMSGVGVVFELITAMEDGDYDIILDQYADLITIGTIADIVPLIGKNRVIVKHGLRLIANKSRTGINALMAVSRLNENTIITSETVAFTLVPRINAAGRLGDVEASLVLMLTEDYEQALHLAQEIDGYNRERKELEAKIIADVAQKLKADKSILNKRIIVIAGENWHHGVIGIVCSRIVDKYGKPCILISKDDVEARGSSRSVAGFSIIEAISKCSTLLTRYGGHPMAAGISINNNNIEKFAQEINEYAKNANAIMPTSLLDIDCEVSTNELSIEGVKSLSQLAPYGTGNEYPVFIMKNMELNGIIPLSNGKHTKIKLTKDAETVSLLCFGMQPEKFEFSIGEKVNVVFTADINVFNGNESVSLKLKDMRLTNIKQDEMCKGIKLYDMYLDNENLKQYYDEILPDRNDAAIIYRWLKLNGEFTKTKEFMYIKSSSNMGYCKFCILLEIMSELGLIDIDNSIKILKVADKKDFNSSRILQRLRGM